MSRKKLDQFNELMSQLADTEGNISGASSHDILDTELAREVLDAIVGGLIVHQIDCSGNTNPYDPWCGTYRNR